MTNIIMAMILYPFHVLLGVYRDLKRMFYRG